MIILMCLVYKIKKTVLTVGRKVINRILLGFPSEVEELFKSSNILNEQKKRTTLRDDIREFLHNLIPENGNRLVIFVDELDRCRPDFAVKLLERIKHYFTDEQITFVFSVNIEELVKTIQCFYGEKFDANRYLGRFFDMVIKLHPINLSKYYAEMKIDESFYFDYTITVVIDSFQLELRDITRFLSLSNVIKKSINNIHKMLFIDQRQEMSFGGYFVVPIMMSVRIVQPEIYDKFIRGEAPEPFIHVMKNLTKINIFERCLLRDSESFEYAGTTTKFFVDIKERAQDLYNALFSIRDNRKICIGNLVISREISNKLIEISSLLSEFSQY